MPIQFDKFDQQKIDRLKSHLETQAKKGSAKFYEIFVDSLRAVPKTDEPSEFDDYENYMTPDTYQIRVLIYNSPSSPRNDQYVFSMKAANTKEALDMGLDGVELRMLTKTELSELKNDREKYLAESSRIRELNEEIEALENELEEKRHYIEKLEDAVERAKENGNKLGGVDLGRLFGVGVEYLIKNNAKAIAKIPGLDGIAALIEQSSDAPTVSSEQTEDSQVSFTKKTAESNNSPSSIELNEEESQFLALFRNIQKTFDDEEIYDLLEIIDRLSRDKEKLPNVIDVVRTPPSTIHS